MDSTTPSTTTPLTLSEYCFPAKIKKQLNKELVKQTIILIVAIVAYIAIAAAAIVLSQIFFPQILAITTTLAGASIPFIFGFFFSTPYAKRVELMQKINIEERVIEKINLNEDEKATLTPTTAEEAKIAIEARSSVYSENIQRLKSWTPPTPDKDKKKKEKTTTEETPETTTPTTTTTPAEAATTPAEIPVEIQAKINQIFLDKLFFDLLARVPTLDITARQFSFIPYDELTISEQLATVAGNKPYAQVVYYDNEAKGFAKRSVSWNTVVTSAA